MKEEWRETVEYYNRTRECVVPKTHDEVVTEEEWNDYVPGEARKVGHKVLCGFIVIKVAKKPTWRRHKRKTKARMDEPMREVRVIEQGGFKIAM